MVESFHFLNPQLGGRVSAECRPDRALGGNENGRRGGCILDGRRREGERPHHSHPRVSSQAAVGPCQVKMKVLLKRGQHYP